MMFGHDHTKPKGAIVVDGREVAETMQCVHCGGHYVRVPGSGTRRGFCTLCHGVTCGAAGCDACVPFEKRLERIERGLPPTP